MADDNTDAPEEWRPVPFPEYADKYQVSSHGRGRKILKTYRTDFGHVKMGLCKDDKVKEMLVHRLVAMAFISLPPSPYHEVAHRNGNPADNRLANLRWVTSAENKEDNRVNGTMIVGERHHAAKLTAEQVSEIRALYALGGITQEQLGERFGVHGVHIGAIIRGVKWRHVGVFTDPPPVDIVRTDDALEEWRPVPFPEFADKYFVSSQGRCARMLKPRICACGDLRRHMVATVGLTSGGRTRNNTVHRLVALAFLGPPPTAKHMVAHWDGNSLNNHVSNLRWATARENREDARRHGTLLMGERCSQSVITEAQALEIHALWAANDLSRQEIADRMRISRKLVDDVLRGKTWKHLGIVHERRPRQGWSPNEETRAKIGTAHRGKLVSEETRAKMSAFQKGKKVSDEARAKMSASRKGRKPSPEAIEKAAAKMRGRPQRSEVVEAMRGRRHSEETKRKISERALERFRRKLEPTEG